MDRFRIADELARQGAYCEGRSPLYAELLRTLAEDARTSPAWVLALEEAWGEREFAVGWEAAHLFLAGLHYCALRGEAPELAAVYPSCGGRGAAGPAAKAFLRRAPAELWTLLRSAHVQTNEIDRSVAWMIAAAAAFGARSMPFHLVELGASAGLNLVGDQLPHECRLTWEAEQEIPTLAWEDVPLTLLSRTGLDIHPRRLEQEADRVWLKACVWADDLPRLARLERAIQVFLRLAKEASGPRLERCTFSQAPAWLAQHRPAARGEGLLIFNSIATIYLGERAYAELQQGMAGALAPWEGRAIWVEYERARGAAAGPLELTIHRSIAGRLETRVLGSGAPRPRELRLRPGWEFCTV